MADMYEYEIFISYKTINANFVRQFCEILIANKIRIWFAEYEIMLDIYDDITAVYAQIHKAIENSTYAILFTNDKWAESGHCRNEYALIRSTLPPQRIAEVQFPSHNLPHEYFPELSGTHQFVYNEGVTSMADIISFVNGLGWLDKEVKYFSLLPSFGEYVTRLPYGITFKSGSFWQIKLWPIFKRQMSMGPHLSLQSKFNEYSIHLEVHVYPYKTPLNTYAREVKIDNSLDDLSLYKAARGYAQSWVRERSQTIRGVHLFFSDFSQVAELRSNFAMSGINEGMANDNKIWVRRYAVLVTDDLQNEYEVDFVFYVNVLSQDQLVGMQRFCMFTHLMDFIVDSLSIKTDKLRDFALIYLAKVCLVIVLAAIQVVWRIPLIPAKYLALFTGFFIGDLLTSIIDQENLKIATILGLIFSPKIEVFPYVCTMAYRILYFICGTVCSVIDVLYQLFQKNSLVLLLIFLLPVLMAGASSMFFSSIGSLVLLYGYKKINHNKGTILPE